MLPFLKKKPGDAGIATVYRSPDSDKESSEQDGHMKGVEVAMRDFCDAENKKDYKAMATALRAAFEILDAMPHEEGEHTDEE